MAYKGEGILGRGRDQYRVDPREIIIKEGWNPRFDFDGENELVNSIIENGVRNPITVKKDKDDNLILLDGERRLRASLKAIEMGADLKAIPAYIERSSIPDTEALILGLIANDGKRLLPVEEAYSFKKLVNWGYTTQEVATKIGRTAGFVEGRLLILDGSKETQEAINSKTLPLYLGEKIIKESEGDKKLEKELVDTAKKGKKGREEVRDLLEKEPKKESKKEETIETIKTCLDMISEMCDLEKGRMANKSWTISQNVVEKLNGLLEHLEK
jgi:ParB family chromosome partitioning protein